LFRTIFTKAVGLFLLFLPWFFTGANYGDE